jgi:hypothetical protein
MSELLKREGSGYHSYAGLFTGGQLPEFDHYFTGFWLAIQASMRSLSTSSGRAPESMI